jgi:LmbE family N-acetylglucosaminyl deacetylase
MGNGGMLAKYSAAGARVHLVMATRGEQGWFGPADENPGPGALGKIREKELLEAARVLGIHEVSFLGYVDGELESADPDEVVADIAEHIRRVRPDVVVTWDPFGFYGHPDHIAICRLTTSAVASAADASYISAGSLPPHSTAKLYYMAWTDDQVTPYEDAFGELAMEIDGEVRRSSPWPAWSITTKIDTSAYWRTTWEAISRHRSQLPGYQKLLDLPQEAHLCLWGTHYYYRVFGPTGAANGMENDLLSGLVFEDEAAAVPYAIAEAVLAGCA